MFFCLAAHTSFAQVQAVEDDFEGAGTINSWFGDDCGMDLAFNNPHSYAHTQTINFPHSSSPIMKKALHRGKAQNVAPESPRDAYKKDQSSA